MEGSGFLEFDVVSIRKEQDIPSQDICFEILSPKDKITHIWNTQEDTSLTSLQEFESRLSPFVNAVKPLNTTQVRINLRKGDLN